MSPRTANGLKYFKLLAFVAAASFIYWAVVSILKGNPNQPLHTHAINTIADKLLGFIGTTMFGGVIAFVIGWLIGGEKSVHQD